jgi:hypothetical protein
LVEVWMSKKLKQKHVLLRLQQIPKPDNLFVVLKSDTAAVVEGVRTETKSCLLYGALTKLSRLLKSGWVVSKLAKLEERVIR